MNIHIYYKFVDHILKLVAEITITTDVKCYFTNTCKRFIGTVKLKIHVKFEYCLSTKLNCGENKKYMDKFLLQLNEIAHVEVTCWAEGSF